MPYVEVWIDDPEPTKEQAEAIAELIRVAFDVSGRRWPDDDAVELERAARAARRAIHPSGWVDEKAYPLLIRADEKYREWKAATDSVKA